MSISKYLAAPVFPTIFYARALSSGLQPADLPALEPAPYAKLTFPADATIGAADLVIDVDQSAVNLDDLDIYVPESTVRGSFVDPGTFGDKQRMVYWHHDANRLYITIVAPQGINGRFSNVVYHTSAWVAGIAKLRT